MRKVISVGIKVAGTVTVAVVAYVFGKGHLATNKSIFDAPEMPKCSSFEKISVALVDQEFQLKHPYVTASALINATSDTKHCPGDAYGCDIATMQGLSTLNAPVLRDAHGTMMLSILTSSNNPQVKIGVIKFPDAPQMFNAHMERTLNYAAARGVKVVVFAISTKLPPNYKTMAHDEIWTHKHVRKVHQRSITAMQKFPGLIVNCAGNQGANLNRYPVFPGSFAEEIPNLLLVANANEDNTLTTHSNYGRMVQVAINAQPEVQAQVCETSWLTSIFSPFFFCTTHPDDIGFTSEASGYVGRLAAELMSVKPGLSPRDTISLLRRTGSAVTSTNDAQKETRVIDSAKALAEAAKVSAACSQPLFRPS